MLKYFYITGDTHGGINLLERAYRLDTPPEETCVIVLGDAGVNFYLNKTDKKVKQKLQESGYTFLCLRGNHEERPENLGMKLRLVSKRELQGAFYFEDEYPNILYFANFGLYFIKNYFCYAIGGAYSVDKDYRLKGLPEDTEHWTGWFKDEQLTIDEMLNCENNIYYIKELTDNEQKIDFVFTHTCPIQWEPSDTFLPMINQSQVDKTMELWLEEIEKTIPYKIWLFGHYHADRMERPHVQLVYKTIEEIDDIYNRWCGDPPTIDEEYWLPKSPFYYEGQQSLKLLSSF